MSRHTLRAGILALAMMLPFAAWGQVADVSAEMGGINERSRAYLVQVFAVHNPEKPLESSAIGSGQLVRGTDGVPRILTNAHVVGQTAQQVWVQFDGAPFAQKVAVLGRDSLVDLALLEAPKPLPAHARPIPLATQPVSIGQRVYAFGFPDGSRSLSYGVVISQSSSHTLGGMSMFFSHQAPISPGSSGGALICLNGGEDHLCGINTAVGINTVGSDKMISNFGFSIRARGVIDRLLPRLEKERSVSHAFMGLRFSDTRSVNPVHYEALTKNSYPPPQSGILVLLALAGSPAARSGIQAGDMIRECELLLDGQWVKFPLVNAAAFTEEVFFNVPPGTKIRFKTERGTEKLGREFELVDFSALKQSEAPGH